MAGIFSKVNFVNKVPLLTRATSNDPNLPSGHIYEEISRITYESLDQCDLLVEFLTERLKKNSPHVKLKVLFIMKHAVQKGNKEFQQSLSKQAEGIRQAKSYNGPSDPLHGDAPYVKVREAAGELMEILFDTDQERTSYDQGRNSPMFMQGFGSTGSNSQKSSRISSCSMKGFGNSSSQGNQDSGMVGDFFQRVKDNMSYAFTENVEAVAKYNSNKDQSNSAGSYRRFHNADEKSKLVATRLSTFNLSGSTSEPLTDYQSPSYKPAGQYTEGQWNKDSYSGPKYSSNDDVHHDASTADDNNDEIEATENDWSQEVRLVNDIATPGGVKMNPSRSELEHFIKQCHVLDLCKIMELVDEKLCCPDYKVQMKSLFVIESVLNSSIPNAHEVVSNGLLEDIEKLSTSSQTAVKNKATKLLHLLKPVKPNVVKEELISNTKKNASFGELLPLETGQKSEANEKVGSGNELHNDINGKDELASMFGGLIFKSEPSNLNVNASSSTTSRSMQTNASAPVLMSQPSSDSLLFGMPAAQQPPPPLDSDLMGQRSDEATTTSVHLLDLDPFNIVTVTESSKPESTQTNAQPTDTMSMQQNNDKVSVSGPTLDFLDPFSDLGVSVDSSANQQTISSQPFNSSITTNVKPHAAAMRTSSSSQSQIDSIYTTTSIANMQQPAFQNPSLVYNSQLPPFGQTGFSSGRSVQQQVMPPQSGSVLSNDAQRPNNVQGGRTLASIPSRNNSATQVSNGFQFLSSKKPGAFDFVKDAMEASKKK